MARRTWVAWVVVVALLLGFPAWSSEPQGGADEAQVAAQDASALAVERKAAEAGVVVGEMFEFDLARAQFASQLLEEGVSGATCQIVCPRNRVGGISCPVGQPCQCSCPGDYPDCSCRP